MLRGSRLLVTLLVPLVAWLASLVVLPGVDSRAFASFGVDAARASYSVVALGLGPVLSAFLLVELVALVVPPLRHLRRGTPAQRRPLHQAALVVTFVVAAMQAFYAARLFQRQALLVDAEPGSLPLLVLSLVGGTALLLVLARLIDRHGLGNGVSVLLGANALEMLARGLLERGNDPVAPGPVAAALVACAVTALATGAVLVRQRPSRSDDDALPVRAPTSGLNPLAITGALVVLPHQLGTFVPALRRLALEPDGTQLLVARTILIGVLAWALTLAFYDGDRLARVWSQLVASAEPGTLRARVRAGVHGALGATLLWLFVIAVLVPMLAARVGAARRCDPLLVVALTAVALDIVAEWRARRRGVLVRAWSLHQVALLDPAEAALARAGITVHARAARHRALLQFFGPYLPVDLYVPADRAEEATRLLGRVLVSA